MPKPALSGLAAAVRSLDDIAVKGTPAMLARKIGLSRAAPSSWDDGIPLKRLPAVQKVTHLPLLVLRPDVIDAIEDVTGLPREALHEIFRDPPIPRSATRKPRSVGGRIQPRERSDGRTSKVEGSPA